MRFHRRGLIHDVIQVKGIVGCLAEVYWDRDRLICIHQYISSSRNFKSNSKSQLIKPTWSYSYWQFLGSNLHSCLFRSQLHWHPLGKWLILDFRYFCDHIHHEFITVGIHEIRSVKPSSGIAPVQLGPIPQGKFLIPMTLSIILTVLEELVRYIWLVNSEKKSYWLWTPSTFWMLDTVTARVVWRAGIF